MLAAYLLIINTTTFILFGLDKRYARRSQRRIPERTLFLAAMAGGTIGALAGMHMFRHKTLHRRFALGIPVVLLTQVVTGVYLFFKP